MRPIFGDKETLKQIDPYRKLLDEGITIPKEDVPCRFCCGALTIEFDDTWIEGHEFGAGTIRWDCETEPDMESDAWDDWMDSHAYVYQHEAMEDEAKIARWIQKRYPTFKNYC